MEEIINSQTNALGINEFLNSAKDYTSNAFPDLDIMKLFSDSITGDVGNIFSYTNIGKIFTSEIHAAVNLMVSVLIIIIIHSIFKAIIENLGNSTASNVVYFVQYLIITTVVINSFVSILSITREAITNVINFMNLLIPLMTTLMLTTGSLVTTSMVEPILLFLMSFIGNFINSFLIPILLISITISIVSNFSDKIQIDRLSKFLKSSIVWSLGIILTIFTCTLSLEGNLSSSVDGLTAKTAKATVSILKNSVGIIGVIIIIGIVLIPIIKMGILWFSFRLTSSVCEIVADGKIVKLIDQISDSYKILMAILISVSVMFIIGITIVIKITNSALMYR